MITWIYNFLDPSEHRNWAKVDVTELTVDKLLVTLPRIEDEFEISYEFMAESFKTGWQNVIHITIGGDMGVYGDRIASLWVLNQSSFYIASAVSGNKNHVLGYQDLSANDWIKVKVYQRVENQKYTYGIEVNGYLPYSTINTRPAAFGDVKVYAADPWSPNLDGKIRNIHIKVSKSKCTVINITKYPLD